MTDKSKMLATFLIGAAVGGAVAWFLTSEKGEEFMNDLKSDGAKMKTDVDELLEKGKKFVNDLKQKAEEII